MSSTPTRVMGLAKNASLAKRPVPGARRDVVIEDLLTLGDAAALVGKTTSNISYLVQYNRLRANPNLEALPRTCFFAGKAVILDLAAVTLSESAIVHLVDQLSERGIRIMGLEGADPAALGPKVPPVLLGGRPGRLAHQPVPPTRIQREHDQQCQARKQTVDVDEAVVGRASAQERSGEEAARIDMRQGQPGRDARPGRGPRIPQASPGQYPAHRHLWLDRVVVAPTNRDVVCPNSAR